MAQVYGSFSLPFFQDSACSLSAVKHSLNLNPESYIVQVSNKNRMESAKFVVDFIIMLRFVVVGWMSVDG